jgi:hypothetical protein
MHYKDVKRSKALSEGMSVSGRMRFHEYLARVKISVTKHCRFVDRQIDCFLKFILALITYTLIKRAPLKAYSPDWIILKKTKCWQW